MMQRLLSKFAGGDVMGMLAGAAPEMRVTAATIAELLEGAEHIGPRSSPAVLAPLFAVVGQNAGIPPQLLAAIAHVATGNNPAHQDDHSIGMMGVPLAGLPVIECKPCAHCATIDEIAAGVPIALERLRHNVVTAAAELITLRKQHGGLSAALVEYGRAAGATDPQQWAGDVVLAMLVYQARAMSADGRAGISSALRLLGGSA